MPILPLFSLLSHAQAPAEAPDVATAGVATPTFDIRGPEWAAFGTPIEDLHENLDNAGKLLNLGGRTCFTADRTLMDAPWFVQVCSYDGKTTESVMLVLSKAAVQAWEEDGLPDGTGALYGKLRAGLEGQYGPPTEAPGRREIWLDAEGDQLSLWTGEYALGTGWKTVFGIPLVSYEGTGMASVFPGIILSYRQAPGIR